MTDAIKSMQLYPRAERLLDDLAAIGIANGMPVDVETLNQFDQLHYHGTEALDVAIDQTGMAAREQVLEIGSGWGGCARYLAHRSGAHVTAVELQEDYNRIAQDLTNRSGLKEGVTHLNADFLEIALPRHGFDHAVSWLALFHIPGRARYLGKVHDALKPGGNFYAEDLYLISPPDKAEQEDFKRHLFPNSLVNIESYRTTLREAGFEITDITDMTEDWATFTATRLEAFRNSRSAYVAVHGTDGYRVIETFYDKMAGYFARGLVGGIRFMSRR
ncbi:Demethylrebeccamycin-D-glucose O-methyltransferase [Roseovarius albus]|uniref:Demethylrebeccamycin-D-glucose O-methyltransferase n=1 Tax=Roseovarius albus TaxID=1247867 RepID=A0A1X7A3N1_9RHOB|nr:class I SAM-dependent methyltransferase [Roseovarius albus]SLN69137.1 Demethylrebeccamycin-D-glucose O-methyltransferase [Roseovarius albus]